jgi:hypothetical protein
MITNFCWTAQKSAVLGLLRSLILLLTLTHYCNYSNAILIVRCSNSENYFVYIAYLNFYVSFLCVYLYIAYLNFYVSFLCVYFNLYCVCFNLLCNVWVCLCVGFVICGYFVNMCTCMYCVLYCFYCVFCIVLFMYIYSYFFYCICTSITTTANEWQLNCCY